MTGSPMTLEAVVSNQFSTATSNPKDCPGGNPPAATEYTSASRVNEHGAVHSATYAGLTAPQPHAHLTIPSGRCANLALCFGARA